jgi:glucokinase
MMIESIVAGKLVMTRGRSPMQVPKLLADIGGTNARFGLELERGQIIAIATLPCNDFGSLSQAIQSYLSSVPAVAAGAIDVEDAAIAVAANIDGDKIKMTNNDWVFSTDAVRKELGLRSLVLLNDFSAMALSIPYLGDSDKLQVGGGSAQKNSAIGLVGPGTGFGVSALVPLNGEWTPLVTEGGHVNFAPSNELECQILQFAWREYPHVSVERLLSGIGLNIVYRALCELKGAPAESLTVAEIIRRALGRECEICDKTIEAFCEMLGTATANVALTIGARGGMYIGGGIVPRLGARFAQSGFRRRFEAKGRFSSYLSRIPTVLITAEYPTFQGLSAKLAAA